MPGWAIARMKGPTRDRADPPSISPIAILICSSEEACCLAVLAMPVIRPLISLIRPLIRCNACPVSTTSLLPVPTCSELAVIAAALSSSEAACCSVRRDRSSAAERISSVPLRMTPEVCETPPMVVHSESIAALKSVRSSAKRSGKSSVIRPVNCPAAAANPVEQHRHRLPLFQFERLGIMDVDQRAAGAAHLAPAVLDDATGRLKPAIGAALHLQPVDHIIGNARLHRLAERGEGRRDVIGVEQIRPEVIRLGKSASEL